MSEKRKTAFIVAAAVFVAYSIAAARPVPPETVLAPRWLHSLEAGQPVLLGEAPDGFSLHQASSLHNLLPFELGGRFGFVEVEDGRLVLNREAAGQVSMSPRRWAWAEFGAEPESVAIYSAFGDALAVIDRPGGYPFFLDGRTFVIGSGQDSVSEIDDSGGVMWTFEFSGPITSLDAAAGLLLAGSLDGVVVLVDGAGRQVFSFEPGGSRFSVILGAAMSGDGSRIAVVSGIDSQRFLVLERFGAGPGDFRVVYHEFLGEGFRRPVHVAFVDGGRRAVFEREGGLGIYDAGSRATRSVEIEGELRALDGSGGQDFLFAVFSCPEGGMRLVGMRASGGAPRVVMSAPFAGEEAFLGRSGARLVVGGGRALAAFDLERR